MDAPENYLTPDEVAKRLRASRSAVYRWILSGKLRSVRRGGKGRRLISEEALAEFLNPPGESRAEPIEARTKRKREYEAALEVMRRAGMKV